MTTGAAAEVGAGGIGPGPSLLAITAGPLPGATIGEGVTFVGMVRGRINGGNVCDARVGMDDAVEVVIEPAPDVAFSRFC